MFNTNFSMKCGIMGEKNIGFTQNYNMGLLSPHSGVKPIDHRHSSVHLNDSEMITSFRAAYLTYYFTMNKPMRISYCYGGVLSSFYFQQLTIFLFALVYVPYIL